MVISVSCASCKASLRVRDDLAGRKVKCPKCSGTIAGPSPDEPLDEAIQTRPRPPSASAKPSRQNVKEGPPPPRARQGAGDLYDDDDTSPRDDDSNASDDEDEDLDSPPRKMKRKSKRGIVGRRDLRAIATYQKGILFCILAYFIAIVGLFTLPPLLQLFLAISVLGVAVVAVVFVFLLATKLYSTGVGILLGILTMILYAGMIVLLVINGKATTALKKQGIRVGLLGARMSDFD